MRLLTSISVLLTVTSLTLSKADGSPAENCTTRQYPCLETIQQFDVCKTLHKWCPIIQIDPANFTHVIQKHGRQYPWKTNQTCSNANDSFCPLSFSCRDTCTVDSRVSINTTATTPWGKNCTAGEGYCPLTASCMPIASQCSFKAFYDWKMAGNDSVTPAGQACPAGQTFCPAKWSCVANSTLDCKSAAVNGSDANVLCHEGHRFDFSRLRCVDDNATNPFATFNHTGRSDNGTGYLAACQLHHVICARNLYAVQKCLPHVPHRCLSRNESHNESQPGAQCGNGTYRCNHGGGGCISNNDTCGGQCRQGYRHCPSENSCKLQGSPCPPVPVHKVPRVNCTKSQRGCADVRSYSNFCKRLSRRCTSLRDNPSNFTKFNHIFEHYTPWGEDCGEHGAFCPFTMSCLPKNQTCNREASIAPEKLRSTSMWGEECPALRKFCPLVMACIPSNSPCSLKRIAEFALCEKRNASGNVSDGGIPAILCNHTVPFGIKCLSNMTFCPITMTCIVNRESCSFPLNNSISCENGDSFCRSTGRCISSGHSCGMRVKYNHTEGLNGTQGVWADACKIGDVICPRIHYADVKCKNISLPNNTATACAKGHCPKGRCKVHAMQVSQCFALNKHCSDLANNVSGVHNTLKGMREFPSGNMCDGGKRYCPLILGCVPINSTCDVNSVNDDEAPITPWGEACHFGQYYCPVFGKCVSANIKCGWAHLLDWMKGDRRKSPYGDKDCPGNHTYCIFSRKCADPSQACNPAPDKAPWFQSCPYGQRFCPDSMSCVAEQTPCLNGNYTSLNETFGFGCGAGRKFCPNLFSCVMNSVNCTDFPSNDPSGWATMCQYRAIGCQNILATVKHCKKECPWDLEGGCLDGKKMCVSRGECIPNAAVCCNFGSTFCNSTSSCIPNSDLCCRSNETFCPKSRSCIGRSDPCLGPEECVSGKFFCRELRKCLPRGQSCAPPQPPPSKTQYKLVEPHLELSKAGNSSIFTSGSTIALISIDTFGREGHLQYYTSSWISINGSSLSPDTGLVVGNINKLRFHFDDPNDHGLVLVNYSVISGSVGTHVDASATARSPDQCLYFLKFPEAPVHKFNLTGQKYEINEDEKNNQGYELDDLIHMELGNVSGENHLPSSVFPFIPRGSVNHYYTKLNFVRHAKFGVALIQLSGAPVRPKEGVWQRKVNTTWIPTVKRRSPKSPYLVHIKDRLRFVPHGNWYGNISFTLVGYQAIQPKNNDLGLTFHDLPRSVQRALDKALDQYNVSSAVRDKLRKAGEELAKTNQVPTEAKLLGALQKLSGAGNAQVKDEVASARKYIVKAFKQASEKTGKAPVSPKFRPISMVVNGVKYLYTLTEQSVTFHGRVISVNDQPTVTSFRAYFPPIAYNTTTSPNDGFLVSDVTSKPAVPFGTKIPSYAKPKPLATDVEGDTLGLGVIVAPNSSIGAWFYKADGSSNWLRMDVSNALVNGKPSGNTSVFILPHNARVKFEMHNPSIMWSNLEGSRKASIFFTVWDGTDGKALGMHHYDFPNNTNSLSKKIVKGFMTRLGCDGRPGSRGVVDACGRCGGNGRWCRGCDGVTFSGAKMDHCGNCTGGTTGLKFNFRKDCGGGCGQSFTDGCGVCQKRGRERNFTDCTGKCFGGAKINSCGNCVGGSSGKAASFGKDACGVCGGSGTSCQGCDGVANSGKVRDFCGSCLLPTDANFNSACTKLSQLRPISGPKAGGTTVTVEGAGLHRYSVAKCKFEPSGGGAGVAMANANIQTNSRTKQKYFEVTSPAIASAGPQKLKCTFDSDATVYELADKTFFAYNKTAFTFTSISPNNSETKSSPFNATITGTGFVNTSYVKCVADKFEVDGHFVSATEVKCEFPTAQKSRELYIVVAFGESDKEVVKANAVNFQFWVEAPTPQSVRFTSNLQALVVTMNGFSKPVNKGSKDCSSFFDAGSVTKFGTRAKCVLRTPLKMFILLRGRPTIAPADNITFTKGSLIRKFEEVTKNSTGVYNLTVNGPPLAITPKAQLNGPPAIGTCGPLNLDASKSRGAGGRRLSFQWRARWAATQDTGSLTADQINDLAIINSNLSVLPSFSPRVEINHPNIKIGLKYEFGVTVTNFLGSTSVNSTIIVERQNKQLPSLIVGDKVRKVKASWDTTLDARVRLSPCLDRNAVAAKVLYSWEIDAVGVDIGRTDKPRLRIKKGTLEGGKSYTLTVTATMASDQTLTVTESITLQVESGPLVTLIKGGNYRVVGQSDTIALDGTLSRDPDDENNARATPWYKWECFDSSNRPCFMPDPQNPSREIRMVLDTAATVSIDVAKSLKTKTEYKFVLTFNKDSRTATAETKVFVEVGSPPKVTIRPQKDAKENPTEIVAVEGRVISTIDKTNTTWSCAQEDGFAFIDLSAEGVVMSKVSDTLRKPPSKASGSLGVALVLKKNVLMEGVKYKFRLTSTHGDSSAYTETQFVTNAPPSQGVLEVSPTNGTALDTKFSLSAPEGWSDDSDDLPLKYRFGYYKKRGSRTVEEYLNIPSESNVLEEIILAKGDKDNSNKLKMFVDVSDNRGATTRAEAEITVNPKVISTADLTGYTSGLGDTMDSGDVSGALGTMTAILDSLSEDDGGDPAIAAAKLDFKKSASSSTVNVVKGGGVTDQETKDQITATTAKSTKGGDKFDAATKTDISNTFTNMEASSSSSRRRRRAVSTPTVTPYTPAQAESVLTTLGNLITVSGYSTDDMGYKSNYLTVAVSSGQKMCANLATGQPAAIAKTTHSVISSVKDNFATADSVYIDVACSDCPENIKKPAQLLLGTALKGTYESWACTGDTTCSGTCLVTTQFPYDLLANSSTNASMTNTVHMKLYNPETYAELSVGALNSPYRLRLPMDYNPNTTSYVANQTRIACKRWDAAANAWTMDGCVQTEKASLLTVGNTTYVECECSKLGYISAFATNEPIPTTAAPSTPTPTQGATAPPPVKVEMAFNIDYHATVTKFGKAAVEASIKNRIVSALGINESRIVNLTITPGSIVVNFVLLPEPGANSVSEIQSKLDQLEQAVRSGNFTVTLPDGSTMKADPNSFKSTYGHGPTTLAPEPTKSSELTETEIIIIGVVCGVVALIILIVIVVCCCKKRPQRVNKVSPRSSRQNLTNGDNVEMAERGRENEGYDNNNPNKGGSAIRA